MNSAPDQRWCLSVSTPNFSSCRCTRSIMQGAHHAVAMPRSKTTEREREKQRRVIMHEEAPGFRPEPRQDRSKTTKCHT